MSIRKSTARSNAELVGTSDSAPFRDFQCAEFFSTFAALVMFFVGNNIFAKKGNFQLVISAAPGFNFNEFIDFFSKIAPQVQSGSVFKITFKGFEPTFDMNAFGPIMSEFFTAGSGFELSFLPADGSFVFDDHFSRFEFPFQGFESGNMFGFFMMSQAANR